MESDVEIETDTITIENAHRFFTKRQLRFIVKIIKENYKKGFLNGMKLEKKQNQNL